MPTWERIYFQGKAHTPGPWEIDDYGTLRGPAPEDESTAGQHIADLVDENLDWLSPNGEADARLIAAAPELLEALQVLLMACPVREGGSAHRQATDAIAKATGS